MIDVKFFGTLRTSLKMNEICIDAKNIKDLIRCIEEESKVMCKNELRQAVIFVNEINFLMLSKYKTKLKSGDKVIFLSPASGG